MFKSTTFRAIGLVGALTVAAAGLTGCSSESTGTTGDAATEGAGTFTWWDPYPQHDDASDWGKRVAACGTEAGVTLERTAYDTTALTNQALLSAQEGASPDIILLDNPAVSTLSDTGMLTTTDELGLDISAIDANLIAAGQLGSDTFGVPVGANTLAIYYNRDVLDAAGVDPAAIGSWADLTEALEKVTAAGKKGITFAGIGTEEGSFQFLPWFWGAGADLAQLDSPEAISALQLWTDWLDAGLAPNSVISNSQNTTWEEFLTGDFGFVVNGTWQINSAAEAGFATGVITIPAKDGGAAPAPTGGEFITTPVQKDTDRYATTTKIVECMTTTEGFVETGNTFAYYIPPTTAGQDQILAEHPELATWVDAVGAAKGRTSDDLGTDYPKISEQLWTAVQEALSGSSTPADALTKAQEAAEAALS